MSKEIDPEFNDEFYQKYNERKITRYNGCVAQGKICYSTKTQARNARKELEKKHNKYFRIYQCIDCEQFHFSSVNSKWEKNRK